MKTIKLLPLALASGLFFLAGCATVPETGRTQLMLISPAEETHLGLSAFDELKQQMPVSKDAAANAMVQRAGQRIAAVAELPDAQWEFVLFENPEPNAFCVPGGKVGIHTGILEITRDETGLATVIGHEVAHAVARHGAERLSRQVLVQTGGSVIGALTAEAAPITQTIAGAAYGFGSQLGVVLPHSRQQELEADRIGLMYMARAGYNPEEAIDFWVRFAEYSAQRPGAPWFLRTHPVDDVRIRQLQELLPEARAEFRRAGAE